MRKFLVILFLVLLFAYSYAGQEEDKAKVVIIGPDDTNMIYDWPLWLFNHGYTSSYDSNWMDDDYYTRRRPGAIVIRQPRSPLGAFLDGVGKGLAQSFEYSYRRREQEKYIAGMVKLIELRWQLRKKRESKLSWLDRDQPPIMSREEIGFNRRRIKELDHIIKNRKLNEYLKSKGRLPVAELPEGVTIFFDGREKICWNGSEWVKK